MERKYIGSGKMTDANEFQTINKTARLLAFAFGLINVSIYLILVVISIISFKTIDRLMDFANGFVIAIYGSFTISLLIACAFRIAPKQKVPQVALAYSVLLIFNLLTFFLYYGLSHMFDGETWLH